MKHARTVSRNKLNEWAAFHGGKSPRTKLAIEADVSLSLVNQAFCGKCPGELSQMRICRATGMDLNELFPLIEESEEKLA